MEREDYTIKISAMSDDEFVSETKRQCWLSAFASNNPRAPAHWKTDFLYAEAGRREKPWLYQRGWIGAYRLSGYEPSEAEVEAARSPINPHQGEEAND